MEKNDIILTQLKECEEQAIINQNNSIGLENPKDKERRIMEMISQTEISTALVLFELNAFKTLKSLDRTLTNVDQTLKGIAETTQKMDEFSQIFSDTIDQMAIKMFSVPDNFQPEVSDIETIKSDLIRSSNVVIVLGQEISQCLEYCEIFEESKRRYKYFKYSNDEESGKLFWDYYMNFQTLFNQTPQEIHKQLSRMQNLMNKEEQFMIIVSEVFFRLIRVADGLMKKSYSLFQSFGQLQEGVSSDSNSQILIEMNGNVNLFVCDYPACQQENYIFKFTSQETSAKCPICYSTGVPTCFFPQSDTQIETLFSQINDRTCLVLLGSIFINPLVLQLIQKAIGDNSMIVEVSKTPKLEVGRVKQLIGDPIEITSMLCQSIMDNYE